MRTKRFVIGALCVASVVFCGLAEAAVQEAAITKFTKILVGIKTPFGALGNVYLGELPVLGKLTGQVPVIPDITPALGLNILGAGNPFLPGLSFPIVAPNGIGNR